MKNKLKRSFHDSAAAANKAFPDRLGRFVLFSDALKKAPVYVSDESAAYLSAHVAEVRRGIKDLSAKLLVLNASGLASLCYPIGGKGFRIIMLRDGQPGRFDARYTREMRAVYTMDHELGHHVVENGLGHGRHLGECAADAFGVLRHVQRYGMDTGFFQFANKSYMVVLGLSPIHYTQNVLDRVQEIARERDVSRLSLRKTAELAAQVAEGYSFAGSRCNQIAGAFEGAAAVYREKLGEKADIVAGYYAGDREAYALFVRETMAVMKAHADDPDVVAAGKRFFAYPPVAAFISAGQKTDPVLRQASDFVQEGPAALHRRGRRMCPVL